jgi:thiamine biosynthesis lipoprotein
MNSTRIEPMIPPDLHGIRCLEFTALGTKCLIKFRQDDERKALTFAADALGWIGRFEAKFSRYRPDSIVSRINAAAGGDWIPVDSEMEHMLKLADDFYQRTNGILDPTILPLLRVWDWKVGLRRLPEDREIQVALNLTGWKKVERRPGAIRLPLEGMGLDFGGFGKEYAVDYLARMARESGISDGLIDLGRDIFALGSNGVQPFWHVGVEDGNRPGTCWGGLAISDRAVSASGDYTRHFTHQGVRYGHILDPRSGWPVANGMRAVTVIAPSCLEAGVYSTAVFILGSREGLHLASLARGVEVCAQSESGIEGSRDFGRWLVKAA